MPGEETDNAHVSEIVTAGNHNMATGGYDGGGNQKQLIVVVQKRFNYLDKKCIVYREPYMSYFVFENGYLPEDGENKRGKAKQYRDIRKNIKVSDYIGGGLFKSKNDLHFLGVNLGFVNIIVNVTVPFLNNDRVDGTISVDLKCDLTKPEQLATMLGTDYVAGKKDGNENNIFVTAEGLRDLIGNPLADNIAGISHNFDRTFDNVSDIRNALYDVLLKEPVIKNYGLIVERASMRFSETSTEKIMNHYRDNNMEMEKDKIKHIRNMLQIEISKEEYQEVHRGI